MTIATLHHSTPGVVLARSTYEDDSPRGLASLIHTFEVFENLVEPIELVIEHALIDAIGLPLDPPSPLLARLRAAPVHRVLIADEAGDATRADRLDTTTITKWLREQLQTANCTPEPTWATLRTTAAKVYSHDAIPRELANVEGQPFGVPGGSDERGAYVAGPTMESSATPPIEFDFSHEGFRMELHIRVVWPLWSTLGSPGHEALIANIRRLLDSDWTVAHASGASSAMKS